MTVSRGGYVLSERRVWGEEPRGQRVSGAGPKIAPQSLYSHIWRVVLLLFLPHPPSCSGSRPEIFGTRLEKPQFRGPDESLGRKFPRRKHPIFSTDENRSSPPKSRRVELRRLPTACLRARAFRDPDHFVEDPTGKGIAGLSHPEFIEALSRYGASPIQRGRAVLECEVETAMGSVADSSDTAE